jgi:hypothetical protein
MKCGGIKKALVYVFKRNLKVSALVEAKPTTYAIFPSVPINDHFNVSPDDVCISGNVLQYHGAGPIVFEICNDISSSLFIFNKTFPLSIHV